MRRSSGRVAVPGARNQHQHQRETMNIALVNALAVNANEPRIPSKSGSESSPQVPPPQQQQQQARVASPPSLSSLLRGHGGPEMKSIHMMSSAEKDANNFPKVDNRFKGAKLSNGAKRGDIARPPGPRNNPGQGQGGVELPDIRDITAHKPHRETPKVVKEAALEAEDVARQLREAGLLAEAAALERLRIDLMAPGADLAAKKNEARMLAEKLRAQAKEKAHMRRFARQANAMTKASGSPITITGRQVLGGGRDIFLM